MELVCPAFGSDSLRISGPLPVRDYLKKPKMTPDRTLVISDFEIVAHLLQTMHSLQYNVANHFTKLQCFLFFFFK